MEASAVHAPAGLSRISVAGPLLRLRSDEQLLALFRAGSDDAFGVLHERYRQRLFAYVRQMLSGTSRQDAEDVLQDVFVRAFGALRADRREVNVRAWLYRVAHNRCIDYLRRPVPAPAEVLETSRKPLHDPLVEAQRREDLRRLVADIDRLPAHQRSALLMREIDGLSYSDLADALDVTVPAIKSLLVRARVGLVESAEARDADCAEIRRDLAAAYDRGVKASGRARRHLRDCGSCREYRGALRDVRRSFAALTPGGAGPLALVATKLLGLGGAGAAGTSAAAGGAAAAGAATACKVAAVVCTAAITAAGGVEVKRLHTERAPAQHRVALPVTTPAAAHVPAPAPALSVRVAAPAVRAAAPATHERARRRHRAALADRARQPTLPPAADGPAAGDAAGVDPIVDTSASGGVLAPDEPPAPAPTPPAASATPSPPANAAVETAPPDDSVAVSAQAIPDATPAPDITGGSAPPPG